MAIRISGTYHSNLKDKADKYILDAKDPQVYVRHMIYKQHS